MKQITKAMESAARRTQETQSMQDSLAKEEVQIHESKGRIENQLSIVMP